VREVGATRVLVVTDAGIENAGIGNRIRSLLGTGSVGYTTFTFSGEPTDTVVVEGAAAFSGCAAEALVAVGGGGAIDAAKAIAALSTGAGSIDEYMASYGLSVDFKGRRVPPLVAVSTTSGTGTEVGHAAVIVVGRAHKKTSLLSPALYPRIAIMDPELVKTLPRSQTAFCGLDALAQAIGAIVTRVRQPLATVLALEAIRLIAAYLERVVDDGLDMEARDGMTRANILAGMAMYNADCAADHAFGETLGPLYRVPHGAAVALFLPAVVRYNSLAVPEAIAVVGQALGLDEPSGPRVEAYLAELNSRLNVPTLEHWGVKEEGLALLIQRTAEHPCVASNPYPLTRGEIERVYKELLAHG